MRAPEYGFPLRGDTITDAKSAAPRAAHELKRFRVAALHCRVHELFMRAALEQARLALAAGEVPIGAVVVIDEAIVASGYNQPIGANDPTAHAEVVAIRAAAAAVGNYRVAGARVYVTVEPCLMCVGALVHARVAEVIYGAAEPKAGALASMLRAHEMPGLNHRLLVTAGVLEPECRELIQDFFREKRTTAR